LANPAAGKGVALGVGDTVGGGVFDGDRVGAAVAAIVGVSDTVGV
jgi:hypothetical protein